jgi:type IV pilus assembly protein PilW
MTHHHLHRSSQYVKGFSLIELMVSITIGLVVVIAAMSAYLGTTGAGKMSEAQSRMNEDAQAALTILSQQLRMAGNNPDQPNRVYDANPALSSSRNPVYGATTFPTGTFTTSNFSIRGCDGQFSDITSATSLDNLTCAAGTSTLPDSIALNYEADRFNTVAASGRPTDCLGSSLGTITASLPTVGGLGTATTAVTYALADNRFYVGTSTAIVSPSLYCRGSGTPQPLVENVEDLQFSYGTVSTATTATTATVAGYLSAAEVVTETNLALLANDAARWGKVLSVRICVLIRSENPVVNDADSARYRNCAGTLVDAPDLRLRRAYSTTVVLRNRLL